MENSTKPKKELHKQWWVWAIMVVSVIILVALSGSSDSSSAPSNQDLSTTAYSISQEFVRQTLKAPSTASFPLYDTASKNLGSQTYRIDSYVDAENSYGAKLRNDWEATLTYNGGQPDDIRNWTLDKLIVNDKVVYEASTTTP